MGDLRPVGDQPSGASGLAKQILHPDASVVSRSALGEC